MLKRRSTQALDTSLLYCFVYTVIPRVVQKSASAMTDEPYYGNGDCSNEINSLHLEACRFATDDQDNTNVFGEGNSFDLVIGHIEDVFMEQKFRDLQSQFMEKHWKEFDNNDENKLCYTTIFKEYADVIEKHIETHLNDVIPNFSMEVFIHQLQQRKHHLEGEVFEMLFTFSDFVAFKEMFLDYKAVKEGTVEELGNYIKVTPIL